MIIVKNFADDCFVNTNLVKRSIYNKLDAFWLTYFMIILMDFETV